MEKKKILLLGILLIIILLGIFVKLQNDSANNDALKFKYEYENLNK